MRLRLLRLTTVILAAFTMLGFGAAFAGASTHATPACGFDCFNLFSAQTGPSITQFAVIPGSNGVATFAKAGDKIAGRLASDTYPNADFTPSVDTTVGVACTPKSEGGPGLLSPSSYACLHYGDWVPGTGWTGTALVFESDWSPYGNESGLCAGIKTANLAGQNVTLQPCGVSAKTLWVADVQNAHVIFGVPYVPFINGADANTSQPLALTFLTGTENPANQFKVQRLLLLSHGFAQDQQEWSGYPGPSI